MKFALFDGNRIEAAKGAKGFCPGCSSEMIAKCGERKMNHWSHKATRNCDPWWEPETEWHRAWKNNFPEAWQEFSSHDERTGERHIADIRTSDSLVIEFQHSAINPQEQSSREKFYKNLVWVVDGTRLKYDFPRFVKEKKNFINVKPGIFQVTYPEETFPAAWIKSSVPVIFDFLGTATSNDVPERNILYCLFPKRIGNYVFVAEISRKAFLKSVVDGQWSQRIDNFTKLLEKVSIEWQNQLALRKVQENIELLRSQNMNQNRRRRL